MTPDTAVYALTAPGAALALTLAQTLPAVPHLPARLAETWPAHGPDVVIFDSLAPLLARTFTAFRGHVCIAAAGIVVRAMAPLLSDKTTDPAVVVVDQAGRFAVSLLSGHLGGANDLARRVAAILGGTAVITTATDAAGAPAMEILARERDLAVAERATVTAGVTQINLALAEARPVALCDPEDALGLGGNPDLARWFTPVSEVPEQGPAVLVTLSPDPTPTRPDLLVLHPRRLVLGVGCRKGTTREELLAAIRTFLADLGLAEAALAGLASVDLKALEPGLLDAAQALGVEITFFPREDLARVPVATPSERVRRHIGVESVCEAAALLRAQTTILLAPKAVFGRVTLAAALAPGPRPASDSSHS